jgi:hypothetical protein
MGHDMILYSQLVFIEFEIIELTICKNIIEAQVPAAQALVKPSGFADTASRIRPATPHLFFAGTTTCFLLGGINHCGANHNRCLPAVVVTNRAKSIPELSIPS